MAIVKTTNREGSGPENGETPPVLLDKTKSVVNQGGRPLSARPTRTPGMINRPAPQVSNTSTPRDFWNDTLAELRRVVWPTKEERGAGTVVTIGLLVFFALFITGLDNLARVVFVALGILPPDAPA